MSDKRRRRWVAHDVYFLDGPLGIALYDRFGAPGVALWYAFIAAAKKHHIEGRITYASDAEALTLLGLPGLELVDHHGHPFTLDDFWRLLGDHKVTRRTSRGRATQVVCTRWAEWQDPKATRSQGRRPRRSEPETKDTTRQDAPEREPDVPLDLDLDLDLDHDLDTPLPPQSGGETSASGDPNPNPRATGTSPRQTGTNPRASGARRRKLDAARSRGRTLATTLDHLEALAAIRHEYPDDTELANAALQAYRAAAGEPARG
jgi:hypothetical protein